ncbi:hypothetical protein WJX72_001380 [[Myrmecia] bisecta]|uniref:Uncharacterized protein n=1 Tax=[Myrmecia] bisecta TaxID=41462 RepID=A0AAW1PNY4_9CHLO
MRTAGTGSFRPDFSQPAPGLPTELLLRVLPKENLHSLQYKYTPQVHGSLYSLPAPGPFGVATQRPLRA